MPVHDRDPAPYREGGDQRACLQRRSRLASLSTHAPEFVAGAACFALLAHSLGAGWPVSLALSAIALTVAACLPFVARWRVDRTTDLAPDVDLDVPASQIKALGLGAIGVVLVGALLIGGLLLVLHAMGWLAGGFIGELNN